MYEVFLNERKIVVTQTGNAPFLKEAVNAENFDSVEDVKHWFLKFEPTEISQAILIHPEPVKFWNDLFQPAFMLLPAAGGVVVKNNKLLFIKRNNKWDLPKGKIDDGESARDAATREVSEECGIDGHKITKTLPSTFHIYQWAYKDSYRQWILKETHWFEMIYDGTENGSPQTKENITEIRWFEKNELIEVLANTYESLKQIISFYSI